MDIPTRRAAFRKLHEQGCFVIPNPWDRGSALYLQSLGFKALATSSAGFAFSQGLPDAGVDRDDVLAHCREIVEAVDLPVNADYESGYADEPEAVAANVRLCAETGVAGLSIEDSTGEAARPLYDLKLAVERVRAAAAACGDVVFVARAECFLVGHPDPLRESIRRLQAYAEAGGQVLYAPGVQRREDIKTLVEELRPKPVNVLMTRNNGLTVADLAELGVRRISTGSTLSRTAWTGFMAAAREIAERGSFARLDGTVPHAELNAFFRGSK